jgi:hypothetical protein
MLQYCIWMLNRPKGLNRIAYVVLISEVCGFFELTRIYAWVFSYLDDRISASCDIISVFAFCTFVLAIVLSCPLSNYVFRLLLYYLHIFLWIFRFNILFTMTVRKDNYSSCFTSDNRRTLYVLHDTSIIWYRCLSLALV